MSILIKGMEMPENCDDCWALDDYGDYPRCRITEEQRGYNFPIREKRMPNCPLVFVPPHGIIDREQILDSIRLELAQANAVNDMEDYDLWVRVFDYVRKFPTIIPAEEGEP